MTEWAFRLTVAGIGLTDEQLDALFEAGCDDAAFSLERDGTVFGSFDREAATQEDAVLSAIHDVQSADIDARVLRVTEDDDWLTASEIATRVGRTRQSIGQLVRGDRGPGGFPAPVARHGSPNPLWSWADVEAWWPSRSSPRSPQCWSGASSRIDGAAGTQCSPPSPVISW